MTVDNDGETRFRDAARRFNNWGRWGDDDQRGTLNFITPEMVTSAAGLIQRGQVFSLAIPFDAKGPQFGHLGRFNPMRYMLRDGGDLLARPGAPGAPAGIGGADDVIVLATHGATHWDALAHMFLDGRMWNGYECALVTSAGAQRNDISSYRDRIAGRAVLLDLPRHFGVPWCEPGRAILPGELDDCARSQNVVIGTGDIVLLRFGQIAACREADAWGDFAGGNAPGLSLDSLEWIFDRQIAGVAADTWGVEVRPNEISYVEQPWHRLAIAGIGLLVGEMFDLDTLAADCAEDGIYEMFLSACPLPVTGSVGGPVNPIVIK